MQSPRQSHRTSSDSRQAFAAGKAGNKHKPLLHRTEQGLCFCHPHTRQDPTATANYNKEAICSHNNINIKFATHIA